MGCPQWRSVDFAKGRATLSNKFARQREKNFSPFCGYLEPNAHIYDVICQIADERIHQSQHFG